MRLQRIGALGDRSERDRRGSLGAARAGSTHAISLHIVDQEERALIQALIRELSLDRSPEGMKLREKSA